MNAGAGESILNETIARDLPVQPGDRTEQRTGDHYVMKKNYNYMRRKLFLPEYGRHIHEMIDSLMEIEDRYERNRQNHSFYVHNCMFLRLKTHGFSVPSPDPRRHRLHRPI